MSNLLLGMLSLLLVNPLLTSAVLSPKHQLFEVLRSGNLYRVFRSDQAGRADDHPHRFGTSIMSVLRAGEIRSRLFSSSLAGRSRK